MEQRKIVNKPKTVRVKALKQFKAPDGNGVTMVYPGDVVELDLYTASVLIGADRAEETTEQLHIDREGGPKRAREAALERAQAMDPSAVLSRTVQALQKTVEALMQGLQSGNLFAKNKG